MLDRRILIVLVTAVTVAGVMCQTRALAFQQNCFTNSHGCNGTGCPCGTVNCGQHWACESATHHPRTKAGAACACSVGVVGKTCRQCTTTWCFSATGQCPKGAATCTYDPVAPNVGGCRKLFGVCNGGFPTCNRGCCSLYGGTLCEAKGKPGPCNCGGTACTCVQTAGSNPPSGIGHFFTTCSCDYGGL